MAYSTIQGDTWDMISFRVYGDEAYMSALIAANPAHAGIAVFSGGVLLETPAVSGGSAVANLPPWKQAAEV